MVGDRAGMRKENVGNTSQRSIENKNFDPGKYGMVVCPDCEGKGYIQIQNPKRQCCSKGRSFGFIIKETEENTNIFL